MDSGPVTDADFSALSFFFTVLVEIMAFLSTLRLPEGLDELGKFGKRSFFLTNGLGTVFFLRKRCLCVTTLESRCLWAITVQIRVSCIFCRTCFVALHGCRVARFLYCCFGWLQCGLGLTSRPLEFGAGPSGIPTRVFHCFS